MSTFNTSTSTYTTTMGFTDLPAELRIQVYHHICDATSIPVVRHLREYSGLVLANKAIYSEFEFEAIEATTKVITAKLQPWLENGTLCLIPPSCLADTSSIRFGFSVALLPRIQCMNLCLTLFTRLLDNLPAFKLHLCMHDVTTTSKNKHTKWVHDLLSLAIMDHLKEAGKDFDDSQPRCSRRIMATGVLEYDSRGFS